MLQTPHLDRQRVHVLRLEIPTESPEDPPATCRASSTVTPSTPRSSSSWAVHSPSAPAPITTTSDMAAPWHPLAALSTAVTGI